jgi:hypothetical protein
MKLNKDSREFIELLNSNEVDYLLVGAYAFAFHALPRYTKDIDILVGTSPVNAEKLHRALVQFGFGNTGLSPSDFTKPDQIVQLGYEPNRIDLLTSISGVDFAGAWANRVSDSLDGLPVWFLDRESLLRNKRSTGRARDKADVEFLEGPS